MNRKTVLIAATAALTVAGGAWWLSGRDHDHDVAAAPASPRTSPTVIAYPAGAPQLDYLRTTPVSFVPEPATEPLPARIGMDEDHTVRVFTPADGRVVRIFAEPGDPVRKGQPLVEIDAPDYAAAMADVQKAQAEHDRDLRDHARQRDLEQAGVIARKDLEASDAILRESSAELQRASARARSMNPGRNQDGLLVLRAPVDGVVATRSVNPGTQVRSDADAPMFVVTDTRHLWLLMDVPEIAAGRLHAGQSVAITSDSDPALAAQAVIANLPSVVDPDTRRLKVRALIDNSSGTLRPEMFVRALPSADSGREVARVPNSALVTTGYFNYVFVEVRPGSYERRQVHVAITGHDVSYLDSGVKPGDKVITTGALLLDSEMRSGA